MSKAELPNPEGPVCTKRAPRAAVIGEYVCPACQTPFRRRVSAVRHNQGRQGKAGPFCKRRCAAKATRALRTRERGYVVSVTTLPLPIPRQRRSFV